MGAVRCDIAPQFPARGVEGVAGIVVDDGGTGLAVADRDLHQLVGAIGLESKLAVETARQTGVDGKELVDLFLITRTDETEIKAVHFECDQELIHRFHADHVRPAVVVPFDEAVDLVEEKDSAQRSGDEFVRPGARRSDVLTAEIRPFHLDDFRMPNNAQSRVDLPQRFGRRGLSRSRGPHQKHVVRLVRHRQSMG